jgi:hypothetical protein
MKPSDLIIQFHLSLPAGIPVSERAKDWADFASRVAEHIENYTVPQYGDKGSDQASDYTADGHVQQAKKYLARFGRSSRPGEERLDLMKAAHYLQMAWMIMGESHDEKTRND